MPRPGAGGGPAPVSRHAARPRFLVDLPTGAAAHAGACPVSTILAPVCPGRALPARASLLLNQPPSGEVGLVFGQPLTRILEQPSLTRHRQLQKRQPLCSQASGPLLRRRIGVISLYTNRRWSKPCDWRSSRASARDRDAPDPAGRGSTDQRPRHRRLDALVLSEAAHAAVGLTTPELLPGTGCG